MKEVDPDNLEDFRAYRLRKAQWFIFTAWLYYGEPETGQELAYIKSALSWLWKKTFFVRYLYLILFSAHSNISPSRSTDGGNGLLTFDVHQPFRATAPGERDIQDKLHNSPRRRDGFGRSM